MSGLAALPRANHTLRSPVKSAFISPTARSALGVLILAWVWYLARSERLRPDVGRGAGAAFLLMVLQALSGGLSVFTSFSLTAMMLHSSIVVVLFGVLAYTSLQVCREPGPELSPHVYRSFVSN